MTEDQRKTTRSRLRRFFKNFAVVVGAVVVFVVVITSLLLIRPVRERLLAEALPRIGGLLPGELAVGGAAWPSLGSIELSDIAWVDEADSLLSVEHAVVVVDLFALIRKDVKIEDIRIEELTADVPAVVERFSGDETAGPVGEPSEPSDGGFPREGSLPGIPSIGVENVFVTAHSIRLDDQKEITDLMISGGVNLLHGDAPRVRLDSVTFRGPGDQRGVENLTLDIDMGTGVIDGKGYGKLSPYWIFHLSLNTDSDGRFNLMLTTDDTGVPSERTGILLDGSIVRDGATIRSITFGGTIRTPSTMAVSKDPTLAAHLENLPNLEAVTVAVQGSLQIDPEMDASLTCDIQPNEWIEGGEVTLEYSDDVLTVRRAALSLADLTLDGAARVSPDSITASMDVRMDGVGGLRVFRPDLEAPEPISVNLETRVTKTARDQKTTVGVDAWGRVGDITVDGVHLDGDIFLEGERPSRAVLTVDAMARHMGVAAEIDRRTDVAVRLSEIVIQDESIPSSLLTIDPETSGLFQYSPEERDIVARGIRITGCEGDVRLDARIEDGKDVDIHVDCSWEYPPALLIERLGLEDTEIERKDVHAPGDTAGQSSAIADSLKTRWHVDGPFTLAVDAGIEAGERTRVTTTGEFSLPGPRTFAVILPDSAHVDDMGPLGGEFGLTAEVDTLGTDFEFSVDLSRTDWIDSSAVEISGTANEIRIDTIGVAVDGVTIGVAGRVADSLYDITAAVNIAHSRFIQRLVSDVPDIELNGEGRLTGTSNSPVVNARVEGAVRDDAYDIPEVIAAVSLADGKVKASIDMPKGLMTNQARFSNVSVSFSTTDESVGLMPADMSLSVDGDNISLYHSLRVDTTGGLFIESDTLDIVIGGQDFHARRPFRIRAESEPRLIVVEDVDLEGTLGAFRMSGVLKPDSSDLTALIELTLPEEPPKALVRGHIWPERVRVDVRASGRHDVAVDGRVDGFMLADERLPALEVTMRGDSTGIQSKISIADSVGAVFVGEGNVPVSVVLWPPAFEPRDGPISLEAAFNQYPLVMRVLGETGQIPKDEIVRVDGNLTVGGTTDDPHGALTATVDFAGWPKLSTYRLTVSAAMISAADPSPAWFRERGFSEIVGDVPSRFEGGIIGSLRLDRDTLPVLTARGVYPVRMSLDPPGASVIEDRDLFIEVNSEAIPLRDFDALLPLDIGLGGTIGVEFEASGPPSNPNIKGRLSTTDLEVSVAELAKAEAEADVSLSGSGMHPVVKGDVVIPQALIRVPDLPEHLHPVEGEAILVPEIADDSVTVDTTTVDRSETPADERPLDLELDVDIRIPSAFWIRGRGLDLELAGDLTTRKKQKGTPTIAGELRAVRGSLVILGRTLQLERGTVTFFGGDEINPAFDVVLATTIEGIDIQIILGGTTQKPAITLHSIPEMPEADIVSVLLFGQPFGNLDDDQADLARTRSMEMLASVGAAQLQQQLGGQLDMVTVKSTGADNRGTALALGKYLSPQVLLSYAYALDSESESFVSLEYFLKGQFKIETTYGDRGQGSIGIGWAKDY